VRLDLVQRTMERAVPTNILFLDACRNNPLAPNLARAMGTCSAEIGRGLAPVESGVGTLISFSTQPGNVALDGAGRNSPFAGALVRHLATSSDSLITKLPERLNPVQDQKCNKHSLRALVRPATVPGSPHATPSSWPCAIPGNCRTCRARPSACSRPPRGHASRSRSNASPSAKLSEVSTPGQPNRLTRACKRPWRAQRSLPQILPLSARTSKAKSPHFLY
jgi:hypothetical protein